MIIKERLRSILKITSITVLCSVVLWGSLTQPANAALGDGTITNSYSNNANLFSPNDVWNYLIWRSNASLGVHVSNAHIIYANTNVQRTLTVTYDDRFYVTSRVNNNSSSGYQDYQKTGTYSLCNTNAKNMTLRVRTITNNVTTSIATSNGSGLLCTASSATVTIPTAAYVWDSDLGMYKAAFIVDFTYSGYDVNKTKIEYRMSVNNSGLLSYPANSNSAVKRAGGVNTDAVMHFPFGPTCTQRGTIRNDGQLGRPEPLTIYDMDNGNSDGVAGGSKEVYVRILKNGVPIALRNNLTDNVSIMEDGGLVGTYSESNTRYLPRAASNQNVKIELNLIEGAKYQLQLSGKSLHYDNFIEVGLSSPSIYGAPNVACPNFNIEGSVRAYNATSGGTEITTATPGQTVYFDYKLWNIGVTTSSPITYTAGGAAGNGSPRTIPGNTTETSGSIAARNGRESVTVPSNAANGSTICRDLAWNPDTNAGGNGTATGCVTVGYSYTLTPVVGASPSTITPGESVTFSPSVTKDLTWTSNTTNWTLRRFILPAGASTPAAPTGGFGCSYYYTNGAQSGSCQDITSGTRVFTDALTPLGDSSTNIYPGTSTAALAIGDKVCYALYINSRTVAANQPVEVLNCVAVAKYPALTVRQGMVRTGGAFSDAAGVCSLASADTRSRISMHNYGTTDRGSFGLAALAVGPIENFGSNNSVYDTLNPITRNLLFANTVAGYQGGLFLGATPASTYCLPNMTSLYAGRATGSTVTISSGTTTINVDSVASTTYNFTGSNSILLINGGTIDPGQQVVIKVANTGTSSNNVVRIGGDIFYSAAPTNLAGGQRVPQFLLLVDGDINIEITDSVRELNGIYGTKGNIYTCRTGSAVVDGGTPITDDICDQPLTVKGALIARQVLPYRTAGYNNATDLDLAETFILTPETLIGDYQYSQDNPILRTVRQRELPTRL